MRKLITTVMKSEMPCRRPNSRFLYDWITSYQWVFQSSKMKLLLWRVFFETTGSLFACSLNVLSMNMWSSRINICTGNLHNVSLNSQKNYSIQNPTLFEERGVNSKYSSHVGQFTSWTQSIKLSLFCNTPPPKRCLRFSGNYSPFILNFLTKSVATCDTWWCRFYEEEKSRRGKEIKKRTALKEHWNARCDCYFEEQFSCVHIH